jgi:hypothetical protein
MKLRIPLILAVLVIIGGMLIVPRSAHAVFGLLRAGAQVNMFKCPYPAIVGIGPTVTLLDFFQIEASVAPAEYALARMLGYKDRIWGVTAQVRIPFVGITPVVGVGYSRRHLEAIGSDFYGNRNVVQTHLTPFAGVELRLTPVTYVGAGLLYTMRKQDGAFKPRGLPGEGMLTDQPLFPYVSLTHSFF